MTTAYAELIERMKKLCITWAEHPDGYVSIGRDEFTTLTEAADALAALARELEEAREADEAKYDALRQIQQWCDAYPLDIFPEPDFVKAREALAVAGITIDAVSASNMRHVLTGVAKIVEHGLSRTSSVRQADAGPLHDHDGENDEH